MISAGVTSDDGLYYWDGAGWQPAISPDGGWRWNGAAWVPYLQPGANALDRYVPAKSLGIWVMVLLALTIAVAVVQAFVVNPFFTLNLAWGDDVRYYSVSLVGFFTFVITSSVFLAWFWRCFQNLPTLGAAELQFSSGWAVGWWLVPIACYWKPSQAAIELWKASDPLAPATTTGVSRSQAGPAALLVAWWAAWLAATAMIQIEAVLVKPDDPVNWIGAGSALATSVAALLCLIFVNSVSTRQELRRSRLDRETLLTRHMSLQ